MGIADGNFDSDPDTDSDAAAIHVTESEIVEKKAVALGMLMKILRQGLCRVSGQFRNGIADLSQCTGGNLQEMGDKDFHLIRIKAFSCQSPALGVVFFQSAG